MNRHTTPTYPPPQPIAATAPRVDPTAVATASPSKPPPAMPDDKSKEKDDAVTKRDKTKKKMSDDEVVGRLREIVSPNDPRQRFTNLQKIGQG